MKHIALTHGKFAMVDDDDYHRLIGYKWVAVNLFSDKFYARNQKLGLMSKFIMRSHPHEEFVVDFANGNTLDCRRDNLIKRRSVIRNPLEETIKKNSQLRLELTNTIVHRETTANFSGVMEKVVFEAKHVDKSGRLFNFGTFDNRQDAEKAYERNMKMLAG